MILTFLVAVYEETRSILGNVSDTKCCFGKEKKRDPCNSCQADLTSLHLLPNRHCTKDEGLRRNMFTNRTNARASRLSSRTPRKVVGASCFLSEKEKKLNGKTKELPKQGDKLLHNTRQPTQPGPQR